MFNFLSLAPYWGTRGIFFLSFDGSMDTVASTIHDTTSPPHTGISSVHTQQENNLMIQFREFLVLEMEISYFLNTISISWG
jgi:hypothetical protein